MRTNRAAQLQDTKLDVKVVLSGLWVSILLVFANVDISGFWRADVVKGALEGRVLGAGFAINQTFLVLTTIYILVPSLMVAVSLQAPARVSRTANLVVSLIYLVTVLAVHRRGDLDLLHPGKRRRGTPPPGYRPSGLDLAPARGG